MCRLVALVAVLAAGWLVAPAAAAVQLRRCGGAQCGTITRALDPQRPQGRRIDIAFRLYRAEDKAERAADRRRRGRARVSLDGHTGGVPRDLRAAAQDARPVAGRQPRDGRVGVDRLPVRAVVRGAHERAGLRAAGGAVRGRDPAALRRSQPVRHRLRRRRSRRRDQGARLQARGPVRRLVRHVLRAGLRRAPPVGAALGDARLRLSAAGHGPVVRVVGGDRAAPRSSTCRRARRRGSANCSSASARHRSAAPPRTPTVPRCRSASTRARCRTSSRTPRATR